MYVSMNKRQNFCVVSFNYLKMTIPIYSFQMQTLREWQT